jgi:hypothetical protein
MSITAADFYTNYRSSSREETQVVQISWYDNSNNEYLVFSSATQDPFKRITKEYCRYSECNDEKKFKFIDSGIVKKEIVGVTCETCAVKIK